MSRTTTPKWLLLLFVVLLAFTLVACGGGDGGDDTPEEPTTSETTSDSSDADTEAEDTEDTDAEDTETTDEDTDTDAEAEAETEEDDSVMESSTVTGLTSDEEIVVREGYPCTGVVVGETGAMMREVIRQRAESSAPSIRATRGGDEWQVVEHVINTEGVWYELQANNRSMGFILEQNIQIAEDCPLYEQATTEG